MKTLTLGDLKKIDLPDNTPVAILETASVAGLIPPVSLIRDHLARNLRERRILRALLNLSIRADEYGLS